MMNIAYKIAVCSFAALFMASCNDFLDIKPKGRIIPEKCSDYENLLNDPQQMKISDSYPNYMTDDAMIPYDEWLTGGFVGLEQALKNLYTFDSKVYGDGESDGLWNYSYSRIYTYNVVIENVMGSTEATEEHKRQVRAEALLGRALEYLTLVNAYANHYDPATAATDPGVPLMLDDVIEEKSNLERASVQAVYDQIKADLDGAAPDLPEKPVFNAFRGSKPVAYGVLARMYLYMGDYQKALENAVLSLGENSTLLNLADYGVVNPVAWFGRINVPALEENPENIYIRQAPMTIGLSGQIFASENLLALFDKANDHRFRLYFTKILGGNELDYDIWAPYINANIALTTVEMFLIAAECEARTGDVTKALEYLNKLRANRYAANREFTASTAQEVLKEILDERRREFTFNGCMRLVDLKRLNREPQFAKTIVHEVNGQTYTLEPNSPKYILPIPPNVLRYNPDMVKNIR